LVTGQLFLKIVPVEVGKFPGTWGAADIHKDLNLELLQQGQKIGYRRVGMADGEDFIGFPDW